MERNLENFSIHATKGRNIERYYRGGIRIKEHERWTEIYYSIIQL